MVWRGARFNPRSGRVALIAFFLFFFFSGQTANHIVGISFYEIFCDFVKCVLVFMAYYWDDCLFLWNYVVIICRKLLSYYVDCC